MKRQLWLLFSVLTAIAVMASDCASLAPTEPPQEIRDAEDAEEALTETAQAPTLHALDTAVAETEAAATATEKAEIDAESTRIGRYASETETAEAAATAAATATTTATPTATQDPGALVFLDDGTSDAVMCAGGSALGADTAPVVDIGAITLRSQAGQLTVQAEFPGVTDLAAALANLPFEFGIGVHDPSRPLPDLNIAAMSGKANLWLMWGGKI